MTTKIMCPQCGGIVYATGELVGENPCHCNSRTKRCVACGKDVTHDRRMKDHDGNYWCLSCGIEDQKRRKKAHGGMVCVDCNQKYPSEKMETLDGSVLCQGCAILRRKAKKEMKKRIGVEGIAAPVEGGSKTMKIAIAMLLIAIAACFSYYMWM